MNDVCFESNAVIAEGMIRLDLNMCGLCVSGLFDARPLVRKYISYYAVYNDLYAGSAAASDTRPY